MENSKKSNSSNKEIDEEKAKKQKAYNDVFKYVKDSIYMLRNFYGESRAQLAEALGVIPNCISNYENGDRVPERNELFMIAKHYNVTYESLLTCDFANVFGCTDILINDEANRHVIYSTLLPIVYTDEALENKNFKEAFDLHCEIYDALCKDNADFAELNIDRCTRLYQAAVEDDIIEARANLLWWPMFRCIGVTALNKGIEKTTPLLSKDATAGDVFKSGYLVNLVDLEYDKTKDWDAAKISIVSSFLDTIVVNIFNLKATHDLALCELADYYIAIAYMYNIFALERLSMAESRKIGEEMLQICNLMHNPYAENFYDVFRNPDNYVEVE